MKYAYGLGGGVAAGMLETKEALIRTFGMKNAYVLPDGFRGLYLGKLCSISELPTSCRNFSCVELNDGTKRDLKEFENSLRGLSKKVDVIFMCGGGGTHTHVGKVTRVIERLKLPLIIIAISGSMDNDFLPEYVTIGAESTIQEVAKQLQVVQRDCQICGDRICIGYSFGRNDTYVVDEAVARTPGTKTFSTMREFEHMRSSLKIGDTILFSESVCNELYRLDSAASDASSVHDKLDGRAATDYFASIIRGKGFKVSEFEMTYTTRIPKLSFTDKQYIAKCVDLIEKQLDVMTIGHGYAVEINAINSKAEIMNIHDFCKKMGFNDVL